MTPARLRELEGRCKWSADDGQRDVLESVWNDLGPIAKWTAAQARKFGQMLDSCAYESAALLMVPPNMIDEWEASTLYCVARVTINMNHGNDGAPFYGTNECNVLSLAIAQAALRARARAMEGE